MTALAPLKRSSFMTNVLKLVSGTTVAQAITILTAPIITRMFTPDMFGVLNVFTSLTTIITVVICLRYEFAIVLPEEDADAASLVRLSVLTAFVISALTALGLIVFSRPLIGLLKAPNLYPFLWLIPVGLLIQGFFQALNYWNTRTRHYGRLSIARVAASLTTSAAPILLALTGHATYASLIYSYVAGTFIYTLVLGVQVLKDSSKLFRQTIQRSRLITNLKRYRKFPLVDSWGSFIINLSWQLPSLMLLYFFSETVVGYYSLSNSLILLPLTLIGNSIAQVFYQHASELRSNPDTLAKSVQLVFHRLTAIGLFPAVVLAIAGPQLFGIVFGANWGEAGRYAQILSPWMFALFISTPLGNLFAALERQEYALVINSVILVSRFAALAIGGMTHNIYITLAIWSVTGALVYGGLAFWLLKLTNVAWSTALRSILLFALYAFVPGLLLFVVMQFSAPGAFWQVTATLIAALLYYTFVLLKDHSLREYLWALVPKRIAHQNDPAG